MRGLLGTSTRAGLVSREQTHPVLDGVLVSSRAHGWSHALEPRVRRADWKPVAVWVQRIPGRYTEQLRVKTCSVEVGRGLGTGGWGGRVTESAEMVREGGTEP